ncbi:MAG: PhoH family protein [Pseudomonadota bacterium]|nr:PhoH family protein [Pseudomonadota bacterium]
MAASHYRGSDKRTYVLDTNVLLHDPGALLVFHEHDLVLPITVIEEVDKFKRELTELGRAARTVSRQLDAMRATGRIGDGVPLPGGGKLRVVLGTSGDVGELFAGAANTNDNVILQTALRLHREIKNGTVIFVSRDVNMRIKADALGMVAEDYEHAHVEIDEAYTGVVERDVDVEVVSEMYSRGWMAEDGVGLCPHQFVILKNMAQPSQTAMTRYDAKQKRLQLVGRYKEGVWGIFARNREQLFALDLLLDDNVPLVTLDGMAGTGKTLLAIACGLQRVADDKHYRRLVVARPIFPLGKDVGFLPGTLEEKLNPWMKPIFDNLDLLLGGEESREGGGGGGGRGNKNQAPNYQALIDQKIIEVEPLTYIRGRSLPRQYLVIDEAQNLTPHEVKTVITRAGEGTKVILTGDRYQIDNPYVDATSNGLSYVVERFRLSPMAGHVTLRKGERSPLAETAASLL